MTDQTTPKGEPDHIEPGSAEHVIYEQPEELVKKARDAHDLFTEALGILAQLATELKIAKAEAAELEVQARALLADVGPIGPVEVTRSDNGVEIRRREMRPEERLPGTDPVPPSRPGCREGDQ